jgi:hypothetical protein
MPERVSEAGPMYGVDISICTLPIGRILQAFPSADDLRQLQNNGGTIVGALRIVGGYEVLMSHYLSLRETVARLEKENGELRELVASCYSRQNLYVDDGELQDNRMEPFIDFKRDSVNEIKRKSMARAMISLREEVVRMEAADADSNICPRCHGDGGTEGVWCPSCNGSGEAADADA